MTKKVNNNEIKGKKLLSTTELNNLIGLKVSVKFLADKACYPDFQTTTGSFWYKHRVPEICFALIRHLAVKGEVAAIYNKENY